LKKIENRKIKSAFILIFSILVSFSCASSESSDTQEAGEISDNSKENLYLIARSRFENNFKLIYNHSKDFIICKKFNDEEISKNLLLDYFLYDLNSDEVIFEDKVPRGNIYWIDEHLVKVEEIPGIVKKGVNEPVPAYTFDVLKRKKIKLTEK
jgi:hypothetical protein